MDETPEQAAARITSEELARGRRSNDVRVDALERTVDALTERVAALEAK